MNPETWKRFKDVYAAAMELPPEKRREFIQNEYKGDEPAVREALAMIESDSENTHFLDFPLDRTDFSPLTEPGAVLGGRFRIEALIGIGGMGDVFRATDLELNRVVALKTVRPSLLRQKESRARLRQEAQLISQLNHPGICILYDVRQESTIDYLVMEFLEGETLSDRISHGPLPMQRALEISEDVLRALEYAHRHGVIHCDIKPSNIMLTSGGTKLLDFGIAKLREYHQGTGGIATTPLVTPAGLAYGTPPYVAPELLDQGVADHRSDIYSFGVVLYFLLSGAKGSALPTLDLAKIYKPFQRIIAKCLCENPADRWQDAGDLQAALEMASLRDDGLIAAPVVRSFTSVYAAFAAAAVVILALLAFYLLMPVPSVEHLAFNVSPPPGSQFLTLEQAGPPVISPDGTSLAFVAGERSGDEKLWLRNLNSITAVPLTGSEGASHPFWSPDSRSIGFFARNKLVRIELATRIPKIICDVGEGRGGTWSKDDVIVYSPGYTDALFRVPAGGGVPVPITSLNRSLQENSHRWPSFLPDGKHVTFIVRALTREHSGLFAVSIDGGEPKRIGNIDSSAIYVSQKRPRAEDLLYMRGTQIMAQSFKLDRLELVGDPIAVVNLQSTDTSTTRLPVSVSENGVLVYGGGQLPTSQLIWYENSGNELSRLSYSGVTRFLRLSPDVKAIAVEKLDFRFGSGSLWLIGSQRGDATRFTFEKQSAYSPVWSPDAQSLAFTVHKGDGFDLMWQAIDGSASKVLLTSPSTRQVAPTEWTSDGLILYDVKNPETGWDIYAISTRDPAMNRALLNSPADERQARLTPNGRWLAYTSDEDGKSEVYVRSFPNLGSPIRVSVAGGSQPLWGDDAGTLYFVDRDQNLQRSHVNFSVRTASSPMPLFRLPPVTQPGILTGWEYDVTIDGSKFIAGQPAARQESLPATVVHGWNLPQ